MKRHNLRKVSGVRRKRLPLHPDNLRLSVIKSAWHRHSYKTGIFFNRFPVCLYEQFFSREGRDQHDQGRFRQMEIGDQPIDNAKTIGRQMNKEGHSFARIYPSFPFEQDSRARVVVVPTAMTLPPRDFVSSISFAVSSGISIHSASIVWSSGVTGLDRGKGSNSDMKRDCCDADSFLLKRLKQGMGEMEACRGCGNRAVLFCKNGLITIPV